jgi:hypothetical protein
MTLEALRVLFASDERFARAVTMMLHAGEVTLLDGAGQALPDWRCREVLSDASSWARGSSFQLSVTERGARRV